MGFSEFFTHLLGLGGYEAAAPSNVRRKQAARRRSFSKDEDRHKGRAAEDLRLAARDLDRNEGQLHGVLNRLADYSVPAISPRWETASDEWNKAAHEWFLRWARSADVRGREDFQRLVWLAVRGSVLEGDGAFVLLDSGKVQPIESELIVTPTGDAARGMAGRDIRGGVELDAIGRAVAYWIAPRNSSGTPDAARARRIPARFVVFYRHTTRFDAVRGTAPVATITHRVVDAADLHDSYVAKTRHDSKQGGVVRTEEGMPGNMDFDDDGGGDGGSGGAGDGGAVSSGSEDGSPPTFEDDSLKLWWLRPNESVTTLVPSTPSTSIVSYEEHLVRTMSCALGIPYEFWSLDLRNLSWSTANATVKLAGDRFREIHRWAVREIVRPILDWRILLAIARRELPQPPVRMGFDGLARSQFDAYRIAPPEYLWASEREHLEAAKLAQQMGMPALNALAAERGLTMDEVLDAREAELVDLYRRAARVSGLTGAQVSISQFCDAQTSGVTSIPPANADGNGQNNGEGRE